ncbi:hypothetical protein, conserved [Babesia ovata]|uniref:C3H1-type domain-containing protein n=1 Tax=Babesia ovata TaxID=189622 RepID=A0A2H6KAF4_9APIC|nr:uncharacterized protein BOVATA_014650 [Babesia ovata]GBE59972.1 hypothetical protein, conserved [Babesia ovata]
MDEQRASSLEEEVHHGIDVIVKLTQFSGSEKSIETLINKEIERLEKQHKDCENCQKSHPSSDCPQHKKLEELRKKLETLQQNNKNSPRDLLNNLCTGLEKFLGYENGNYTGEGIVYSDLDRLCDGVMAFLHGVLNEVHKNNNLSPYKETLKDAVTLLESKRYEGKTGLHTVIDDVKRGIERWLDGVSASNNNLKKPLNILHENINAYFNYFNALKDDKNYNTEESNLNSSIKSLYQLTTDIDYASNAVAVLDQNLQKDLLPHVTLIKDRVDAFVDSTKQDHEGLKEVCGKVDEQTKIIIDYAHGVGRETKRNVGIYLEKCENLLQHLKETSDKLDRTRADAYRGELKWLKTSASAALSTALGNADKVNQLDKQIKGDLDSKTQQVWLQSMALNISTLQSGIEQLTPKINEAIGNLSEIIGDKSKTTVEGFVGKLRDEKNLNLPPKLLPPPPPGPPVAAEEKNVAGKVDEAIKAVADKVKELDNEFQRKVRTEFDNAVRNLNSSLISLKSFSKHLAADHTGMKANVTELGKEIDKNQKAFQKFITAVMDAKLTEMIQEVINALSSARTQIIVHITDITEEIKLKSTTAATSIKRHALSQFAASKARALEKLKQLVTEKNEAIAAIIQKDSDSGLKGMMKWMNNNKSHLQTIQGLVTPQSQPNKDDGQKFREMSKEFQDYVAVILQYIEFQVKTPIPGKLERNSNDQSERVKDIKSILDNLLGYLKSTDKICHFDHISTSYLDALNASLLKLSPSAFHGFHNPLLLDALKAGMTKFTEQLSRAYVNRYSGKTFGPLTEHKTVTDTEKTQGVKSPVTKKIELLSTEGRNCARVCLTVLETLFYDFESLSKLLPAKNADKINSGNSIGNFFSDRGYKVATKAGVQDGELDNSDKTNAQKINQLRDSKINGVSNGSDKLHELINRLATDLVSYYNVCHLNHITSPRAPTTVNEMLHWLAGLYYTPMYDKLAGKFAGFFDVPEGNGTTVSKAIEAAVPARRSERMLRDLTFKEMSDLFNNITIRPYHILVTILGHGHAGGRYACDFLTNPDGLNYPTDVNQCFDLLVDICLRLNEQILFLFKQCQNGPGSSGWRDCLYGRGVGGSSWNCNTMQCPNQNGNQKHNQMCNQKCDQSVKCGLKSPLQSFLEDGLQGFLPHQFTSPGCKLECTVSNHKGLPCKTPMGFKDLSQIASRNGSGQSIKDVLDPFCGTRECSLSLICSYFVYLLRRPPQTLGDMFAFYYNILDHWCAEGKQEEHRRKAFDDAVKKANLGRPYFDLDITKILGSKNHRADNHPKGDLFGLLSCDPKDAPSLPCGQYLQSMSDDIRLLYSKDYADNYLSWVVYITETFYELLKKLYSECCQKCNTQGTRCYEKCCAAECRIKAAYKAIGSNSEETQLKNLDGKNHKEECQSIVKCQNTHPTLYKYGFTFGSPWNLSGKSSDPNQKRTCQDLCQALETVCHGRSLLADLVINKIPAFLWEIRYKFFYTLVALWSLSLLYLLHITVVRLDVLRIRSHLRSPSSHRIAAQSLLAAARVKALANVKYFSP